MNGTPPTAPANVNPVLPLGRRGSWPARGIAEQDPIAPYVQGSLALNYPLPSGLDAVPRCRALPAGPDDGLPPTAEGWARRFLQAVVEVVGCDRPVTQLARWTNQSVYAEIAHRQRLTAARRADATSRSTRHQVVTVHVHQSQPQVAEVAARVSYRGRSRAIAARLDLRQGRWLCTAICFG